MELMPLLAASSVFTPFDMASSSELKSSDRLRSAAEVKKLVGLSSAVLTLLPVASRFCAVDMSCAVDCSASRFCRTPADKTIFDIAQGPDSQNSIARTTYRTP